MCHKINVLLFQSGGEFWWRMMRQKKVFQAGRQNAAASRGRQETDGGLSDFFEIVG
jgi:hypothetical protein